MAGKNNIHEKLFKMRESIKKEKFEDFSEFMEVLHRKAKFHKVLPLYCFYENVATLTLVNVEDVNDKLEFKTPSSLTNIHKAKEQLYYMAFDIDKADTITAVQYVELINKMREKKVEEKDIISRYKINSIEEMPEDVLERCKRALDRMTL